MQPAKKILVTGGDGYLGTHVKNYFQAQSASRRTGWNILDSSLIKEFSNYDIIIHMAAVVNKSPEAAEQCFLANAEGTRLIAQNLHKGQTLIYSSTKDVYGVNANHYKFVPETCPTTYQSQTAYAWSKWLGEEYLRYYAKLNEFKLGIFRLSTIFAQPTKSNPGGWVSTFAKNIREEKKISLANQGIQIRDLLPVSELSRVFAVFIESDVHQATFNIGGGTEYAFSLYEIAQKFVDLFCKESNLIEITDNVTIEEQFNYVSDIKLLNEVLNWKPEFNLNTELLKA